MHKNTKTLAAFAVCLLVALEAAGCGSNTDSFYFDRCDEPISDEECYALRRDPSSDQVKLATAIALRYIDEHPATGELFDWTSGVFMFALTELYRVTDDTRLRDYYQAYLDHHIEKGYRVFWSDSCPPALTALALLTETENADYQKVVTDVLEYLRDAPRIEGGGISHLGPEAIPLASIWVDSLFMFGMVLNRHGEAADDAEALALMREQLGIFAGQLQSESGLLVHAYGWPIPFDTDIYWGRGNGWVTASLADYLRVLRLRGESNGQAMHMFRSQVRGILETQDADSGMWWTVMNRPRDTGNYIETSAAALFAYGMARAYRYGVLGEEELAAAKRAVEGVKGAVATDEEDRPFVTVISEGTGPTTYERYTQVPVADDLNYGVGAVILALIETSGL